MTWQYAVQTAKVCEVSLFFIYWVK